MMSPEQKKRKMTQEGGDDPLSTFLHWCKDSGIKLNPKVYVSTENTVAQYGMLSREDLPEGEVVFTIPRSALLSQQTTRIHHLLEKEHQSLDSMSGWVPLLISLMYESTDRSSPWAPYFGLWPHLVPPDLPMFWSEEEQAALLKGTGVAEAVKKDVKDMEQEYNSIVLPFIKRHPDILSPQTHTLELYRRLVAFVMAYSFQEPMEEDEEDDIGKEVLPPMMVPVADLLNHIAKHNTHLEFTAECLRMVTTQPVPAGHELFNTYGQMGNWQLLHMYGFAEPHPGNINETADIPMSTLLEAALQGAESEEEKDRFRERWTFLCRMEIVGEEGAFVFSREEVLTDEELRTSLKLLCMSPEEFAEYQQNDGWEEDDEDDEETMTCQKLAQLPLSWRRLLHSCTELAMKAYATDLPSEQRLLDDPADYAKLSSREQYSLHVRYGQKLILQQLMELTAS
ncbi:N-lysine methyltransferase SETD6 [Hyperolius riggenbachi]|uniref:N-lysine methyltransferase SETD6 n=1 Tax=Hyperolius riggenbachi TaxID=752182 RepID=UPI0035A2B9C8